MQRTSARQRGLLSLILGSCLGSALLPQTAVATNDKLILTPRDAREVGLESLRVAVQRDGSVPLPSQLDQFIKDREAAIQLGKALFWDMQVGSDGVQSCASCHFHAGADNRTRNQFNPDRLTVVDVREGDVRGYSRAPLIADLRFDTRQPNETLVREDFPLIKSIQSFVRNPNGTLFPSAGNSNDVISSHGTFFTFFNGVRPGSITDAGMLLPDPVWNVGGVNVRRVEPRNAPTVINAVFNFTNFWDGRAHPRFNGFDSFGDQNPFTSVLANEPNLGLVDQRISLDNASLASQAMTPPLSFVEMSFGSPAQRNSRDLVEVGIKLLRRSEAGVRLMPLGLQRVDKRDSVLGAVSNAPFRGLSISYEDLIKKAFVDKYWNSEERVSFPLVTTNNFSQIEVNFNLFFGLAVALYQSTLVADQSPFDRWMETGHFNSGFGITELAGLNLFVNQGECVQCHAGPELTKASVREAQQGKNVIRPMAMGQGTALYDVGFYNIGITPTTDDIGRGGGDLFGLPLGFSRQALFDRQGLASFRFPIIGNELIPARSAEGAAVCQDLNGNGLCERTEPVQPAFQRVAVDGAFKTPGLRNAELTGPYFHNGGVATLRQVVQFYNRGGNFCNLNLKDLDPSIKPLGMNALQERFLVDFLVSLTDPRVKFRRAPFDNPELMVPVDGMDALGTRTIGAVGASGTRVPLRPFLELSPQDAIFTPAGVCALEATPAP
jgi:cytochrome c peroxidase